MIKTINVGSDFSGVGAFEYALKRIESDKGVLINPVFACDLDEYARQTYIENHGEPKYFPKDVYKREIPKESLDVYISSPPCQSFSNIGKKLGKRDERGILFFNSLDFIRENNPRFFIFENVTGLLSDDDGKTFSEWTNYLGGKSVNGLPVLFPYENAVNYHLYYKVLNSKNFNIPQSRKRIFLVGIRDDEDNKFSFPREQYLEKTLKSVLENNVSEKHFLSEHNIETLIKYNERQKKNNNGFSAKFRDVEKVKIMDCLKVGGDGANDLIEVNGKIRRLTPRECFRLMDFPESHFWSCSDAQAYKQAGNSICVGVLEKIIGKLNL